jgi:hypothetical protein
MNTWREVAEYVRLSPKDSATLRTLLAIATDRLDGISDRSYEGILANKEAATVLQGPEQLERLKGSLAQQMLELLTGPHDHACWQRRRRIGHVHVPVGLPDR